MTESWRPAAVRGFAWGALAGLALGALMYVAGVFLGLRPWPQALSGPILALMPGFVFGFLIDTLQHAGKVVEELGLRLLADWYHAIFNPPEAGLRGPSMEITPIENFYIVSKNFGDPVVDEHGWSLAIGGAVDKPMNLSLSDLRALPSATEYVTLACISNNVGGGLMSTGSFTRVTRRELLALANPRPNGTWAAFKARDRKSVV